MKVRLGSKNIYWVIAGAVLSITCLIFGQNVFASTDADVLVGTTGSAISTLDGSGRHWLYLIEGGICIYLFSKTKNIFVFAALIVVSVAIDLIIHLASN